VLLLFGAFFSTVGLVPPTHEAKAAGTTYYVDATGGLDTNDGLTTGAAWKTISKVNSSAFNPGDSIYFKKGEIWREGLTPPSSGAVGSPITFGAYGSGNDPIISGANIMQTWTSYSGNTWQKTGVTTSAGMVLMDNAVLTKGTSQDALNDHEWFWAANVLYLRDETGDPDPTGVVIEASQRLQGIYVNGKSHIVLENLKIYGDKYYAIWVARTGGTVEDVTVESCTLGDGGESGSGYKRIYVVGNTEADRQVSNVTIRDTTVTAARGGISITYTSNVLVENVTTAASYSIGANYSDTVTITTSDTAGIGLQGTDNVTISDNTLSGTSTGGAINIEDGGANANVSNILIEGNTISNDTYAGVWTAINQGSYVLDGLIIRNNLIESCGNTMGNGGGILIWYSAQNVEIYENVIINSGKSDGSGVEGGISIKPISTSTDVNGVTIYSNTLYDNYTSQIRVNDGTTKTLKNLVIRDNLLYANGEYSLVVGTNTASEVTNSLDYNLHYQAAGSGNMISWAGINYTQAQWSDFKTTSTKEAHAPTPSDPLFVNAAGGNFALQSGSPAIGAASDGTDIGAYQYVAAVPSAPTLSALSTSSINIVINQNSNPAPIKYAIYNQTTSQYIQTDGSLGASAVWQTYANWGGSSGIANTGLTANTSYAYQVKARGTDNATETALSSSASINTSANIVSTSSTASSSASTTTATSSRYSYRHYLPSVTDSTDTTTVFPSGIAGTAMPFDASGLFPSNIVRFVWDFGDGTTAEGEMVEHTYSSPGRYTITITGYDAKGSQSIVSKTVDVYPTPPTVDNITSDNMDLLITGTAYPNDTLYLTIHSDPLDVQTQADKDGKWTYRLASASKAIGEGDHSVSAIDSYKLADNTELKSEATRDIGFKVSVEDGKLKVEMKKASRWRTAALVLGALVLVLIGVVYVTRRRNIAR